MTKESKETETRTFLGKNPKDEKVFLTLRERQNHTHVVGSTGAGKSKLLELMIRQDIKNGDCGLCLIDPYGELYNNVVAYISEFPELAEKVVLFHPDNQEEMILGFNPAPPTDNISYTVQLLISACLKAWGQNDQKETPKITRWLKNIFYLTLANNLTLVECQPFFDFYSKEAKKQREALLLNIQDQLIIGEWTAFERLTPMKKAEELEGAINRLYEFIDNETIRNMIGQAKNTIKFHECMKQGKIVLINLNSKKESFDDEQANLIGSMIVNEIYRAGRKRDTKSKAKLKPFHVYIDEFEQFVTRNMAKSLEECRKFKISFILAHQHLSQLKVEDESIYNSIITNCRNKIVFGGLSVENAKLMADEIHTGYYDQYKIKHQHKMRAFEPVEVLKPVKISKNSKVKKVENSESKIDDAFKTVYKEFSHNKAPVFFSKEELEYMEAIKTQKSATAFIKIEDKPSVQIKIDHVPDPVDNEALNKKIKNFQKSTYEKNSQYYRSYKKVKKEMYERQKTFFGEPLRFDDKKPYEEKTAKAEDDLFNP